MKYLARRIEKLEKRDAPETVEVFGFITTRAAISDMLREINFGGVRSTLPCVSEGASHEDA